MTVEGIEKSTRAKSTFDTHQNENTRFIVWLFYNYERLIHDELSRASHDFIETVDNHVMLKRKYRGKKSVEERKNHYLFQLLRNKVKFSNASSRRSDLKSFLPSIDSLKLVFLVS